MAIPVSMQLDGAAAGVGQREVRKGLSNFGAGRVAPGQPQPPRMPERRRGIESMFVAFSRHSGVPALYGDLWICIYADRGLIEFPGS